MDAWRCGTGFFNSPFLADSGGEEQDDGLLGQSKASTVYLSHSKWLSVIALTRKAVFVRTKKIGREPAIQVKLL